MQSTTAIMLMTYFERERESKVVSHNGHYNFTGLVSKPLLLAGKRYRLIRPL